LSRILCKRLSAVAWLIAYARRPRRARIDISVSSVRSVTSFHLGSSGPPGSDRPTFGPAACRVAAAPGLADPARRPQFGSDLRRGGSAGRVAIQHQHDIGEPICYEVLLFRRQAGAHQADYAGEAGLVDPHAIEEALHHNQPMLARCPCPMIIEQHLRLVKTRRKSVPWLPTIQSTAAIGHQAPIRIVNRNRDALTHQAPSTEVSHPEVVGHGGLDPAAGQVGMPAIQLQLEAQGWVALSFFRNQFSSFRPARLALVV